ncbi:MAG: glycosyltransferase family 2 protein, partial [Armatimonadota bacterium]
MKLSICMPLRNRRELLRWGLASLCWWQSPDPASFEIVIADDGSTDDPEPVIRQFRDSADIKWIWCGAKAEPERDNNGGPARNVAMRHATGDIIVQTEPEIVH